MPLIFDHEYQKELDALKEQVLRRNRNATRIILVFIGIILLSVAWFLIKSDTSPSTSITVMIALSTICIAYLIERGFNALHAVQAITVGVIEWIGRKQLGEYEKPD